jgi:AbrB family looped-hinge helix DNA binding protein
MFQDNLLMLRNTSGMSQEEVAAQIGVSRQAYAKWERGDTTPDIEKCQRLAQLYDVTLDSLVETKRVEGVGQIPPAPQGRNVWGSVVLNDRGQIVIPKAARDKLNYKEGQRLIVLSEDGSGLALVPAELFETWMYQLKESANKTEG